MKAMKGLSKSMLGSVRGRSAQDGTTTNGSGGSQQDTPEANAARSVRLFCESGGPNNSGDEVLYLPTIVESAESSPAAAKECAQVIRKFLTRDNFSRPFVQYNGIMLVRILSDNPGPTFTRNIDKKFVETVKELLRAGRDPSVKQILIETLENFQREKKQDEGLALLIQMWEKEQGKMAKLGGPPGVVPSIPSTSNVTPYDHHNQNYFSRSHSTNRSLPSPPELASRIEEAKTSAKLLTQLVQSTSPAEFLQNDLIFEFANRCISASRSIQGYIAAQNPAPDNDTMLTLIETNDQLALALSKHQRAVLMARKAQGIGEENAASSRNSPDPTATIPPPLGPPPSSIRQPEMPNRQNISAPPQPSRQVIESQSGERSTNDRRSPPEKLEDPFKDPAPVPLFASGLQVANDFQDISGLEPYHPGFRPSQSYMGRQESAIGKTTMHAAVAPDLEGTEKEVASPTQVHGVEEDSYNVSPVQTKAPIYRY